MSLKIKQGDAYTVPVGVTVNGNALDVTEVSAVEFMLGGNRKLYPDEVTYDSDTGYFLVPMTQEESFAFEADGQIEVDVRVKFTGGNVIGAKKIIAVNVIDAISEEVL